MTKIIVSQGVKDDFDKSDFYRKQMSKETASRLLNGYMDGFYQHALKMGWTKAKTVSEYASKEHGAIYTAAFLIAG